MRASEYKRREVTRPETYDRKARAETSNVAHPTLPYVAPHTAKIHTLITLGIRDRAKPLVLKARKRLPRGFDSHRPLHFWLSDVSLRCPGTRLSLSPGSHSLDAATTVPLVESVDRRLGGVRSRWSHPSVIGPVAARCPWPLWSSRYLSRCLTWYSESNTQDHTSGGRWQY